MLRNRFPGAGETEGLMTQDGTFQKRKLLVVPPVELWGKTLGGKFPEQFSLIQKNIIKGGEKGGCASDVSVTFTLSHSLIIQNCFLGQKRKRGNWKMVNWWWFQAESNSIHWLGAATGLPEHLPIEFANWKVLMLMRALPIKWVTLSPYSHWLIDTRLCRSIHAHLAHFFSTYKSSLSPNWALNRIQPHAQACSRHLQAIHSLHVLSPKQPSLTT